MKKFREFVAEAKDTRVVKHGDVITVDGKHAGYHGKVSGHGSVGKTTPYAKALKSAQKQFGSDKKIEFHDFDEYQKRKKLAEEAQLHIKEEVELEESADADAAADIADHHGVSAQSTGAGHHSVSHPAKGSGFFDHHHAHAPLKAAGWKLKEKHKTESMEGGTYTKGEHTVQVMSRHNPHQNTIVHNIKKV